VAGRRYSDDMIEFFVDFGIELIDGPCKGDISLIYSWRRVGGDGILYASVPAIQISSIRWQ